MRWEFSQRTHTVLHLLQQVCSLSTPIFFFEFKSVHCLHPLNIPFSVLFDFLNFNLIFVFLTLTFMQSCSKLGCIEIILCDVVIMYKLACLQHTSTLLAFRVNKDHDSGEPKLPLADTQEQEHTVDFYQRLFKHRHQCNCNMFRTYKKLWTRNESNDV